MDDLSLVVQIETAISSQLPGGSGDGYGYGGGAVVTVRGTVGYITRPRRVFSISLVLGEGPHHSEIADYIAGKLQP